MEKMERLKELLRGYGKVAVAFSGGVDSSFLLKAACDTLGRENVLAVTVKASVNPEEELREAEEAAGALGVSYIVVAVDVFSVEGFRENPPERCYICKKGIFGNVIREAQARGIATVVDGTNADDEGDYRPGMKALRELGVKSPLKEAGMTKEEIRALSKELGLNTWSKPSLACLASRIPYHEEITEEKLRRVEKAEQYLHTLGFTQYRVRCHGNLARIELMPSEMSRVFDIAFMEQMNNKLRELGFKYVSLDLLGYRTGSLNEVLTVKTEG